jgi:GT2 family glycosyltransferase
MNSKSVTIGVINFNGMPVLPDTVRALQSLHYPVREIVVVDNNSLDGSPEWLEKCHPEIRCIRLDSNIGLPGARNVILEQTTTDFVFIVDNDIRVEPASLTHLMHVMQNVPLAGVCHPEIRDENDPTVHHYNGGWIHYLCVNISRAKPNRCHKRPSFEIFDTVSGAALLVRRQVALDIGGFDKDYFFNWEDGDFTSRLTLAGFQCLNVPPAVVHHRSNPRGTSKVFYQVRNRWYFMLKLYDWRTLAFIFPMVVLFEILTAMFLLKKGGIKDYLRANWAVIRELRAILAKRRVFRRLKKVRDRNWLRTGEMYIPTNLHKPVGLIVTMQRLFYGCCNVYWRIVGRFC